MMTIETFAFGTKEPYRVHCVAIFLENWFYIWGHIIVEERPGPLSPAKERTCQDLIAAKTIQCLSVGPHINDTVL